MESAEHPDNGENSPEFVVVLVEPKSQGNVGAVARAMANFGLSELVLVNPCELGDEAEKRAMHAMDLMHSARVAKTFKEAVQGIDLVIGTSGIRGENDKVALRMPVGPADASTRVSALDGRVGLVFGREDFGLYNEELELCDMLVSIPTSEGYPVMNLSHAVAVLLYEMVARAGVPTEVREASDLEKETLHQRFAELLDEIGYKEHKRENTQVMFRRLIGRATPSKWEFHTLMGVISRAIKRVERLRGTGANGYQSTKASLDEQEEQAHEGDERQGEA